jgi:hypothetical protein
MARELVLGGEPEPDFLAHTNKVRAADPGSLRSARRARARSSGALYAFAHAWQGGGADDQAAARVRPLGIPCAKDTFRRVALTRAPLAAARRRCTTSATCLSCLTRALMS